jgi:twitching motility two-component system response regulator PilH
MERKTRSVLLVDGSASLLLYHGILLKRLAYNVFAAQNGEEALRTLEQTLPTIVLTEAVLSGMSGSELIKHIKRAPKTKSIPVVVLTSRSDAGLKEACERQGCSGFLTKPVEPAELYRRLQDVSENVPRANIRIAVPLRALVRPAATADLAPREVTVAEISEGGMLIQMQEPLSKGETAWLRVFLPDREIAATGTVLYSNTPPPGSFMRPCVGLRFMDIADADRKAIGVFINDKLISDIAPKAV